MTTITLKRTIKSTILGLGLSMLGATTQRAEAGFVVTYEAARVQASTLSGVTTETFDSTPTGVYNISSGASTAVGTFTSPGVAILGANAYGGAGGTGNYFTIGTSSGTTSATLTLNGAQSYFGLWWSSMDVNNTLELYSAGKYLGTLAAATILNNLGASYNGNPNNGSDTNDKFAYLNIYGTSGTTIDQVVFRNVSTATGFELDNISIRSAPVTPMSMSGTTVANAIVPEPSSLALMSIAGLIGGGTWFRKRRQADLIG